MRGDTRGPTEAEGNRLNIELSSLLIIAAIAVAAPLISELPVGLRLPIVVVEIVLGIAVGPHGLGLADSKGVLGFLGLLGLTFLFFLAGFEIDFDEIRGRPMALAAGGGWSRSWSPWASSGSSGGPDSYARPS